MVMSSLAKDLGQADGDPQMPILPYGEDIEATWSYLEAGINRIMLESASGIDLHSLMGLYSAIHNHCTSQKAITYQRRDRSSSLLGEDIYTRLSEFLGEYLTNLKQHAKSFSGEALLRFYIEEWVYYVRSARSIDRILAYLNRHWIRREIDEGKKDIYNVHTLYLVKWFREFYSEMSGDVTDIVLKLVEKDRDSESNETSPLNQINAIVDSLASLDLNDTNPLKYSFTADPTHLEKFFIEVITAYFEAGPDQLLPERLVSEYRMALSRLKDEEERVFLYLHPNIMPQLSRICNTTATLKLATGDLAVIEVDRPVAECSVVIKHLLEDVGDEAVRNTSIPLPNVNEAVLRKVLQWCEHHKNDCHEPAIATRWSISYSDEWDQNYMQMDQDMLFDVIEAANYLDIQPLITLSCRKVANMIESKTPEEIRRIFNITNDFTPEEEEQIRRENEWAKW